jgi:pSer/pThr/pTyr-binding forkhead associated (FHA) protein
MTDPTFPVSLTIDLPDGSQQLMEIDQDSVMVGSGSSANVQINDDAVSSIHCMLKVKEAGRVTVLDLGSDEGTLVNGGEITGETELEDGDKIQLGGATITVHCGGEALAPTIAERKRPAPQPVTVPGGEPLKKEPEAKAPTLSTEATIEDRLVVHDEPTVKKTDKVPEPTELLPDRKGRGKKKPEKKAAKPAAKKEAKKPAAAKKESRTEQAKPKKASVKKDAAPPPPKKEKPMANTESNTPSGTGMPVSINHDFNRGHHVHAAPLTSDLSEQEAPPDKSNVDVTMMWGETVMGVTRLTKKGAISIGDGAGVNFEISDASIPGDAYELVKLSGNGAQIVAASGMTITVDGAPAGSSVTLEKGQVAKVEVGAVTFVVQYAKKYAALDEGVLQAMDFFYTKILAIFMILQVGLLTAMFITPHFDELDDDDLFNNAAQFQALILKKEPEKKEKKQDLSGKKGAKHKDEEGLFGKKDKPKEDKLASKKGAPKVDKDKREEDRKIAQAALAKLGLTGDTGAASNVFGPGGLGSGINNALGGLRGTAMGDAGGAGGLGTRGTGAGGGGNALGIGGLGSGTGRGSGGTGNIDLGGRGKGMTRIRPGKVTYVGSLSREEIQRVVRRFMSQIKYCYEKELQKDPNLQGKLVANWIISGTGLVQTASMVQNTMKNKTVEKCVVRIIKRMRFPKPRGGGVVTVTYPFVFTSSGG